MPDSPRPETVLAELAERLHDRHRVDLGVTGATEIGAAPPVEGFRTVRHLLVQRASDLQGAIGDVSATIQRVRDLEQLLPFTALGWPARQSELAAACATRPRDGVAAWLDDWFAACAAVRLDACDRLVRMEASMPAGCRLLVARCRAARTAIETREYGPAAPVIVAGARGVAVGGRLVPAAEVRQDLWVLLIRLALSAGRPEEARRALQEASETGGGPVLEALAARLRSAESGWDPEDAVGTMGVGSPDAMLERARILGREEDPGTSDLSLDEGLAAARSAIAAARSLEAADEHVRRMLDPVPAQVHLALAERAIAENDAALARRSLLAAEATAPGDAVSGEVHGHLADLAQRGGDRTGERDHLVAAARAWDGAGRIDHKLLTTDRLLAADPQDVEALCLRAESLLQLSWTSVGRDLLAQLRQAKEAIGAALALLDSGATGPGDREWLRAWVLYTESYVRGRLADLGGTPVPGHRWRALCAALQAVALRPGNGTIWPCLADAAYDLELWSLAELAAGAAVRLDPQRRAVAQHVRALTNLGEYERALAALGEPASPFEWDMTGHILVNMGRIQEAVASFDRRPPQALNGWARQNHVTALLLAGRRADAMVAGKDLDAWLRVRLEESYSRRQATRVSLILGDDERAGSLAAGFAAAGEHGQDFELAVLAAARGQSAEASALLISYVRSFTSIDQLRSWENAEVPVLAALIGERGAEPPDLLAVRQAQEGVRTRLTDRRDPLVELAEAEAGGADGEFVATAKALGPVIVAVARGDARSVADRLDRLGAAGHVPIGPLRQWAEAGRESGEPVAAPAATTEAAGAPPADPLAVVLPPSWLGGATGEQPGPAGARVLPDAALEPDRYRILAGGKVLEEGATPADRRLLPAGAVALLPAEVAARAEPVGQPQLRAIGEVTIPDGEGALAALLSCSPLDAALERLRAAAHDHAAEPAV